MKNRLKMIQLSMQVVKTGLEMNNDEIKDITRNIPEKLIRDSLKKNSESIDNLIEAIEELVKAMDGVDNEQR